MNRSNSSFQPAKLDVDSTLLDKSLHFVSNPEEEELNSLFSSISTNNKVQEMDNLVPEPTYPTIMVTPSPGICIKTKTESGQKFFLNLCKLNEIPPPPPITAKELEDVISREDYSDLWRVPMSIGAPRKEVDKSGGECLAAEIAVNRKWFEDTMLPSTTFTTFVITVAIEGLCDKNPDTRLDRQNWIILKNKKMLGDKPPQHRIQQRASAGIEEVKQSNTTNFNKKENVNQKKILIKELDAGAEIVEEKSKIIKKSDPPISQVNKNVGVVKERTPKFKIVKDPIDAPKVLLATVSLEGVRSKRELTLDIGEDRLVLEARKVGYLLDIFLPYSLDQDGTRAQFDTLQQELKITIPIVK